MTRLWQAALIGLLLGAAPALAQGFRGEGSRGGRGAEPGSFDFYVLALSWSPGFCALEGERRGEGQCEPGRKLGFVVHGLWPQYERGYPSECGAERGPTRDAVAEVMDLFPTERLARYQWRKHGTCSGKSPVGYFRDVRRAVEQVRIPDRLKSASAELRLAPLALERAFAEANPGLRPDMMAVSCRRDLLQEVRICFDKDLSGFRSCPEVDRSGCRFGEITVETPR